MTQPSELILRKVMKGDRKAFAELYSFYRVPALRFCTSLLKDEEEAENILHEVFIKIWQRRAHIRLDLNFNSYFFTCLRNHALDYFKRMEKNRQLRESYRDRLVCCYQEETDEEVEKVNFVNKMVSELSEKRRKVLLLAIYEGKSYQEIAEQMHISKNTVKNQLVKARQILREQILVAYP